MMYLYQSSEMQVIWGPGRVQGPWQSLGLGRERQLQNAVVAIKGPVVYSHPFFRATLLKLNAGKRLPLLVRGHW